MVHSKWHSNLPTSDTRRRDGIIDSLTLRCRELTMSQPSSKHQDALSHRRVVSRIPKPSVTLHLSKFGGLCPNEQLADPTLSLCRSTRGSEYHSCCTSKCQHRRPSTPVLHHRRLYFCESNIFTIMDNRSEMRSVSFHGSPYFIRPRNLAFE
jgi:hypothetical protein